MGHRGPVARGTGGESQLSRWSVDWKRKKKALKAFVSSVFKKLGEKCFPPLTCGERGKHCSLLLSCFFFLCTTCCENRDFFGFSSRFFIL